MRKVRVCAKIRYVQIIHVANSLKAILTLLFPRSESLLQKRRACTNEAFVKPIIKTKKRAQRQLID